MEELGLALRERGRFLEAEPIRMFLIDESAYWEQNILEPSRVCAILVTS